MDQFRELKTIVLEELRKQYASTIITLWFDKMEIVEISGTEVTLSFPASRKLFVEANYSAVLTETFTSVLGVKVDVKFISPEEVKEQEAPQPEPEKQKNAYQTRFNADYTFETFIVGKSNQLAHTAAMAVAKNPFHLNNPLYLYGPSGLGKTHLLYAIMAKLREDHPEYSILYVTGEEFTIDMIESLAQHNPAALREKYRSVDVLLVDDIQFISGKIGVQEEFFHTFETLFRQNKQLIIASDVAPERIDNLEDRLRGRFSMGLVADIQPPDLELRTAIFRRKALDFGFDLDLSVLNYLAENITRNIRQIEGAIKKLRAHCFLTGDKCTVKIAELVLSEFLKTKASADTMFEKVLEYASKKYMVSTEDILGNKRTANIVSARHFAVYMVRKTTNYSQKQIAELFKRKDHTTIINSINVMEQKVVSDPIFAREMAHTIEEILQG